ncbi:MAG: FtsH protease activity modulator HflK [Steroidobacteraceae bacterium]|jgi:membrane protease subunit HflK
MAWNTPGDDQRGKTPRPSPPGNPWLLQLLRSWQQRLQNFGGGGPAGRWLLALLVIAVLAGIWLASGFYQLEAGERGLVQRFGRNVALVGPGLGWRLPWPIETVNRVDVGHGPSIDLQAHLLSADASVVTVSASVQYQFTDPVRLLGSLRSPEVALREAAASALQLMVGHSTLGNVLTGAGRDSLAHGALALTQASLDAAGGGVHVLAVNITDIQLPDTVVPDQREVSKALEDQTHMSAEAQGYASDVLPRARAEADRLLQDAGTYKSQAVAAAEADIARFEQLSAAYAQAPEVTRNQLYIQTMESIYSRTNKVIIDGKGGANNMVYLPLDKLLAAGSGTSSSQGAAGSAQLPGSAGGSTVAPANDSGSAAAGGRPGDDELRSRDREDR